MEGYRDPSLQPRVPIRFAVRFRPQGRPGRWERGTGLDLSPSGLRFVCPASAQLQAKLSYELKLTVTLPRRKRATLQIEAEVRWYKATGKELMVGLWVANPVHRQVLARVLARLPA